jgi:CubicO group peptidase (beta-lactamase class C family)
MPTSAGRRRGRVAAVAATTVAAAVVLAGCSDSPPTQGQNASPSATSASGTGEKSPDTKQLTAAVDRFLEQSYAPGKRNVRAVLVTVGGQTVVERYYRGSDAGQSEDVRSVTKSVMSTLVGVALSEGDLEGLDQRLDRLLPAYAGTMTPEVAAITLRDVLSMTAGLPADDGGDPGPWVDGADWVRSILKRGTDQAPKTGFAYSSASSHLLAAILVQATGQPLLDYARAKLLDPLGIKTRPAAQPPFTSAGERAYQRADFAWPVDPQGVNTGFCCLKLTAADSAKLGNLFLNGGTWQGKQLVPADWVAEATSAKVRTEAGPGSEYGYQWWITSAGDHPAYAAVGFGGQLIEVVPDLELVVVASSVVTGENLLDASFFQLMTTSAIIPALE